jgi:hypothetical protein
MARTIVFAALAANLIAISDAMALDPRLPAYETTYRYFGTN